MAFTLRIRQKKLFGKTVLDIPSLAHACGFCYGSNNDFYILQENEQSQGTAVFYNPERIGRGIFFNGGKAREGYYEISYNRRAGVPVLAFRRNRRNAGNNAGE